MDSKPISVFAPPPPMTDRRALSQAWYSALHTVAPAARRPNPACAASVARGARPAPRMTHDHLPSEVASRVPRVTPHAGRDRMHAGAVCVSARPVRRDPLAVAVVARVACARPAQTAVFTASLADGSRVQLWLRVDGPRAVVRAVCARRARTHVAASIAGAARQLHRRGYTVDVRVVGV